MRSYKLIPEARELIRDGRAKQAFELLLLSISDLPFECRDDIRILNTQFKTISKQIVLGLEHEQTPLNKVIYGLLQVLSQIEQGPETANEQPLELLVIKTKTSLLFEFHQETIKNYKTVYMQLSAFFDGKSDEENSLVSLNDFIENLLQLTEKMSVLNNHIAQSQIEFKQPELIALATERKAYIFEEMPIAEIKAQIEAVNKLQQQFQSSSLKKWGVFGVILLVIIVIIILLAYTLKNG